MVNPDLLVFDMDGVLVDVTESYRETIVQTVKHFSGRLISRDFIQDYKNRGGWNNDWALTQRILRDFGFDVPYDTVVEEFNKLFLGHDGAQGLIHRERWVAEAGLFERLARRYQLAIFTGRMRYEVDITLDHRGRGIPFDPIICAEDVERPKPDPQGLLLIQRRNPGRQILYFGDVVDDARSARAAAVPFVGVNHRPDVKQLLRGEGAVAVIDNLNQIEEVLAR
jgi:HAD superfamily hydrolase (TIGR01548 family)